MSYNDEIFKQDAFKNIEPEKIELIKQFINNIQGKSMNEVMLQFMSFYKKFPKGKELSKSEKDALISCVYFNLSEADKEKFKSVLKLINN